MLKILDITSLRFIQNRLFQNGLNGRIGTNWTKWTEFIE